MNNFLNFILLGKGMMIRSSIGGKTAQDERDGMMMDAMGRGNFFGGGKNNLVVGEDRLEVKMVRDLTPHVGRIIYFDVIKVNINKA
jgi:hypothetical protein